MPFAIVDGEPVTEVPRDLYIPPQALEVFLEAFEGPLDLLLYLIRRQNLDILDIPIADITRQYMEYIQLMQELDLELAGEYLLMAAMLAEIKSRMLLPRVGEGGEEEEDPRAELVRRLQEYERFKRAAEDIDALPRLDKLDLLLRVDVRGTMVASWKAAELMAVQSEGGAIINISWDHVATGMEGGNPQLYSAAKGALMAMTLSVGKDYLQEGIRCNSISPGRVHTPFVDGFLAKNYPGKEAEMFERLSQTQPIGRMARPDEVAALALYLCSDEASFITGSDYPIDGGFIKLNA